MTGSNRRSRPVKARMRSLAGGRLSLCDALLFICITLATTGFTGDTQLLLVADPQHGAMPLNFRSTLAALPAMKGVDEAGLAEMRMIGSGQFSPATLDNATTAVKSPLTIVDLRQESHGFVNDTPVTWIGASNRANLDRDDEAAARDERERLGRLRMEHKAEVVTAVARSSSGGLEIKAKTEMEVHSVYPEAELARREGFGYLRIYVTDGMAPRDFEVDRLVRLVREVSPLRWLYFHCRAGRGRTTTFMAMYDMMRNARIVSFNDIIERERQLGGVDLSRVAAPESPDYHNNERRFVFLKRFYEYCRTNRDAFRTGWTKWLAEREKR